MGLASRGAGLVCRRGVGEGAGSLEGLGPLRPDRPQAVNLGAGLPTSEEESGCSVLPKVEVLEGELRLNNTRGLDTGAQHILFCGHVARGYQALQV